VGWLILALLAVLVLSAAAFAAPAVFGPVLAGAAPLLFVIALIGLGGVWWRRTQTRVDPETTDAPDRAPAVAGEDDIVET
jgi:FtsH-binding integral membrane protein